MDLDAYVSAHQGEWARLRELSGRRRLDGAEVDELVTRYQQVATQLSVVRSAAPDPALLAQLSQLVGRARARTTGGHEAAWRDLVRFFVVSFPAGLYRSRYWWGTTMLVCLAVAAAVGCWIAADPAAHSALGSRAELQQLVQHDFESYYSEHPASSFAARVWTNNAWIAALCLAAGVLGLPVLWVLLQNSLNLGMVGGVMAAGGRLDLFFGLILPHGLLELTAVFVAAGAGLRLFWAWVEPGPRTRGQALGEEGRATIGIAMGLVIVLAVSGVIEAFVTPSPLPTWARIGIGVLAEVAFLGYVFTLGRWAVRAGQTGDLERRYTGDVLPTAG